MKQAVIGLDTSNYRTSAALVSLEGEILANARLLLPVTEGERGLRQSDAVFAHIRQYPQVMAAMREVMKATEIVAVAASTKPRDGEASYMPVFQLGTSFGKGLAELYRVPFYATTHQRGHMAAAAYGVLQEEEQAHLALHLSGGTTDLLYLEGNTLTELGTSLDLHVGQLVDRVGVALGLHFPAGEELETLALKGKSEGKLGCSMAEGDLCCHFSGMETKAIRWIREGQLSKEDIAREVYDGIARTVCRMLQAGCRKTLCHKALIAGGVAASGLLRTLLQGRMEKQRLQIELVFGRPELSGDNAVGVALLGRKAYLQKGR